jgi:hypothetical protein
LIYLMVIPYREKVFRQHAIQRDALLIEQLGAQLQGGWYGAAIMAVVAGHAL